MVVDSGNDDRYIVRSKLGLAWDGLRLVEPMAERVDDQAQVAMNPSDELDGSVC